MLYFYIDDHKITALVADEVGTSSPIMFERSVMNDKYDEAIAEIALLCRDNDVRQNNVNVFVCGPVTIAPTEEIISKPEVIFDNCYDFTDKSQRKVYYDEISSLHSLLIFGVDTKIIDALSHHFSEVEVSYRSSLTPLLEVFSSNYQKEHRLRTYLHCREGFVDIFAFDGRNLTIMNSFPVCSVSDAIYYTIALSKSIGNDVHTRPFFVCGSPTMAENLKQNMQQFATTVHDVDLGETLPSSFAHLKQQLPHSIAAHLSCV